jgi:hypothetical protein
LKNLNRLGRLKKIRHRIKLNNFDLISLLITDNSDNYEYFAFKYNIPNDLKEDLLLSHKCFKSSKNDKFFFKRDLKKNIYFYGKQKLLTINTILFCEKLNFEMNEYFMVNKKINSTQIPKLKFDGRFLVSKGLSPGPKIGIILKEIEDEWVTNDFEISSNRVIEIINSNKY